MHPKSNALRTAALAVAAVVASLVPGIAAPASATTTVVSQSTIQPVTWVDDQGRQYVLADTVPTYGGAPLGPSRLTVIRDRADGTPDTSWGPNGTNQRALVLTPPATGATWSHTPSVSATGIITLVWNSTGCQSAPGACDRWFSQIDATGAAVAAPVLVGDVPPLIDALPDGSVLTGTAAGPVGWRGPDGTDRGAPAVPAASVRSASVDGDGRLLVATADGTVTRWPAGGPAELTVDTTCDGAEGIAVGSSTAEAGGFAVACSSIGSPVSVTRYADTGTASWTGSDGAAPASTSHLQVPAHLAITPDDVVWVAGGGSVDLGVNFVIPSAAMASFTSTGTVDQVYERTTMRPGHYDVGVSGVSQIRAIDDHHVAMVDVQRCCFTMGGTLPLDQVIAQVLPLRPSPPTCYAPYPFIAGADATSVEITFSSCAPSEPTAEPTSYRVEATTSAGTVSTTVAHTAPSTLLAATVGGLPAGRLVSVRVVPVNDQGDAVGAEPLTVHTVLPFRSVNGFVARAYAEGDCVLLGLNEGESKVAAVNAGTLAPADHVASVLGRCEAETRVEPVARLYQAALQRAPETAGLRYWVDRSRAGVTLPTIARHFAGSAEFARRYGALSNRAYVEHIYRNVLGRAGDPTGVAFWTKRLDQHQANRGEVLAQFSQSAEHVRRTDPQVQPTAAWFLMVGRVPTAAERQAIATFDQPRHDAVLAILALPEYAARVGS
jgi:hypothetical protein